ncbi:hypothetical protein ACH5RR_006915 [Cinchona calisaya]|uniref:Amino acid transporter transmembrane domain-containing protein n=1 Tax=Cinchona calisaya TaxID=153742 RepID=A0ABD3AQF5_9GENT
MTAVIGAGVLGLPYAMSELGWDPGITIMILSWVITLYTLWQMVEMHEVVLRKRLDRYHELGLAAFGEKLGLWIVITHQLMVEVGVNTVSLVWQQNKVPSKGKGSSGLTQLDKYLIPTTPSDESITVLDAIPLLTTEITVAASIRSVPKVIDQTPITEIRGDHQRKLCGCKKCHIDEDDVTDSFPDSARLNRVPQTRDQLSSTYREFLRFLRNFSFEPMVDVTPASLGLQSIWHIRGKKRDYPVTRRILTRQVLEWNKNVFAVIFSHKVAKGEVLVCKSHFETAQMEDARQ